MTVAEKYLGRPLGNKVATIFREWVQYDSFGDDFSEGHPHAGPPIRSVRELCQQLFGSPTSVSGINILGRVTDLEMPLRQALRIPCESGNGMPCPLEMVAYSGLCFAHLPGLLRSASRHIASDAGEAEFKALIDGSPYHDWDQLTRKVLVGTVTADIARELLAIFWDVIGDRSIRSFFYNPVGKNGYRKWGDYAAGNCGDPLKSNSVTSPRGTTRIEVDSYKMMMESGRVCGYEWRAELFGSDSQAIPDAIAYGMAYTFERDRKGLPYGGRHDLLWASDVVSDTDVSQVAAFFEQQVDADDLIAEGDLLFVWLWERRAGSSSGVGVDVLEAAIKDLKKRFRRIKTIIFCLAPTQFCSWGEEYDPPAILIEKQEAIEKLQAVFETMDPGKWVNGEARFTVKQFMGGNETLAYLGKAAFEEENQHLFDDILKSLPPL